MFIKHKRISSLRQFMRVYTEILSDSYKSGFYDIVLIN